MLVIVLGSTILGFLQEYSASNAVDRLRSQVTIKSSVVRGGQPHMLPSELVVPGDVVLLSAGSLIPADGIVLEANDFFVNQAVLTGETFPAEKKPATVAANASLAERTNCVFMGFVPLPASLMAGMLGLTALYVLAIALTKKYFYAMN